MLKFRMCSQLMFVVPTTETQDGIFLLKFHHIEHLHWNKEQKEQFVLRGFYNVIQIHSIIIE